MRTLSALLIAFFFALPGASSAATLQEASVNLYCRIKLGGITYASTGSGVFISDRGIILTNAHVAQRFLLATSSAKSKTECVVRSGATAKDTYTAQVLYMPPQWFSSYGSSVEEKEEAKGTGERDFALLYVTGMTKKKAKLPTSFPTISLSKTTPTEGLPVSIAGYPAEGLDYGGLRDKLKFHTASSSITDVRSFTRPLLDVLVLAPSTAGKSGVSGGPVIYSDGTLAGIVSTMGGSLSKGMRSVRAVSTSHIERTVQIETGASLSTLLLGDLKIRAEKTEASIPPSFRAQLEKTLRRMN